MIRDASSGDLPSRTSPSSSSNIGDIQPQKGYSQNPTQSPAFKFQPKLQGFSQFSDNPKSGFSINKNRQGESKSSARDSFNSFTAPIAQQENRNRAEAVKHSDRAFFNPQATGKGLSFGRPFSHARPMFGAAIFNQQKHDMNATQDASTATGTQDDQKRLNSPELKYNDMFAKKTVSSSDSSSAASKVDNGGIVGGPEGMARADRQFIPKDFSANRRPSFILNQRNADGLKHLRGLENRGHTVNPSEDVPSENQGEKGQENESVTAKPPLTNGKDSNSISMQANTVNSLQSATSHPSPSNFPTSTPSVFSVTPPPTPLGSLGMKRTLSVPNLSKTLKVDMPTGTTEELKSRSFAASPMNLESHNASRPSLATSVAMEPSTNAEYFEKPRGLVPSPTKQFGELARRANSLPRTMDNFLTQSPTSRLHSLNLEQPLKLQLHSPPKLLKTCQTIRQESPFETHPENDYPTSRESGTPVDSIMPLDDGMDGFGGFLRSLNKIKSERTKLVDENKAMSSKLHKLYETNNHTTKLLNHLISVLSTFYALTDYTKQLSEWNIGRVGQLRKEVVIMSGVVKSWKSSTQLTICNGLNGCGEQELMKWGQRRWDHLHESLKETSRNLDDCKSDLQRTKKELSQALECTESLSVKNSTLSQSVASLTSALDNLSSTHESFQSNMRSLQLTISTLQSEKLEVELQKSQSRDAHEKLSKELANSIDRNNELSQQLSLISDKVESLQKAEEALTAELGAASKELDKLRDSENSAIELYKLKENDLRTEVEKSQLRIIDLDNALMETKQNLYKTDAAYQCLQENHRSLTENYQALQSQHRTVADELQKLQSAIIANRDAQTEAFKVELTKIAASKDSHYNTLVAENKKLQDKIADYQTKISSQDNQWEDKFNELKFEKSEIEKKLSEAQLRFKVEEERWARDKMEWENQKSTLECNLEQYRESLTTSTVSNAKLSMLIQGISVLKASIPLEATDKDTVGGSDTLSRDQMDLLAEDLETIRFQLRQALKSKESLITELQEKLSEFEKIGPIDTLKRLQLESEGIRAEQKNVMAQTEDSDVLAPDHTTLQTAFNNLQAEHTALRENYDKTLEQLKHVEGKFVDERAKCENELSAKLRTMATQLDEVAKQREVDLLNQIKKSENQIKSLETKLNAVNAEKDDWTKKYRDLEIKFEQTESSRKQIKSPSKTNSKQLIDSQERVSIDPSPGRFSQLVKSSLNNDSGSNLSITDEFIRSTLEVESDIASNRSSASVILASHPPSKQGRKSRSAIKSRPIKLVASDGDDEVIGDSQEFNRSDKSNEVKDGKKQGNEAPAPNVRPKQDNLDQRVDRLESIKKASATPNKVDDRNQLKGILKKSGTDMVSSAADTSAVATFRTIVEESPFSSIASSETTAMTGKRKRYEQSELGTLDKRLNSFIASSQASRRVQTNSGLSISSVSKRVIIQAEDHGLEFSSNPHRDGDTDVLDGDDPFAYSDSPAIEKKAVKKPKTKITRRNSVFVQSGSSSNKGDGKEKSYKSTEKMKNNGEYNVNPTVPTRHSSSSRNSSKYGQGGSSSSKFKSSKSRGRQSKY
ncbi:hypothetical protein BKA69DRAFT_1099259 [Paraphysoderma sedebokerense]|nr:hypothetical protein BKA69DRAFT_1099259 [Paraphysoderma sedebokerense]